MQIECFAFSSLAEAIILAVASVTRYVTFCVVLHSSIVEALAAAKFVAVYGLLVISALPKALC